MCRILQGTTGTKREKKENEKERDGNIFLCLDLKGIRFPDIVISGHWDYQTLEC
jgi:hypothetical protein